MSQYSNDTTNIVINGLSWGLGEWQGPRLNHRGIEQYFRDIGYQVRNTCITRNSHAKAAKELDRYLGQTKKHCLIFWIQTDPLLDLVKPEAAELGFRNKPIETTLPKFSNSIQTARGLISLLRQCQNNIYSELHQIAEKHNTVIHCIGGSHNLYLPALKQFDRLVALIPSWINLMVPDLDEIPDLRDPDFGICYTWPETCIDYSQFDTDLTEQVRREFQLLNRYEPVLREDIFHPDGLHPNRFGHKILFEEIVKKLNI